MASTAITVGTKLLCKDSDNKWVAGQVISITNDGLCYEIQRGNALQTVNDFAQVEEWALAEEHLHKTVAKRFGDAIYEGKVTDVWRNNNEIYFHIEYSDGDREDFDFNEFKEGRLLYRQNGPQAEIRRAREGTTPRRTKKRKTTQFSSPPLSTKRFSIGSSSSPHSSATPKRYKQADIGTWCSPTTKKKDEEMIEPPPPVRSLARAMKQHQEKHDDSSWLDEKKSATPDAVPSRTRPASYRDDESSSSTMDAPVASSRNATNQRQPRRARAAPKSYKDDDDYEESPVQKKRRGRPHLNDDDEESSVDYESEESEDFHFEKEPKETNDFSSEDDDESVVVITTKSKKTQRKPAPKAATQPAKPAKKSMKDSFEPINRPLYPNLSLAEIKKTKQFLDPCGQEATDDIISMLVGEQVDKIQALLQRALAANNHLGSAHMPLQLGTACSGTDAPALALTLVQEQLELRGLTPLAYEHKFSCEVEPFKQAYLARNFDSLLYPDICKLTDEVPRDAYGQAQPIPEYNLFVAGTSCKNFSMLRANKRLDIEDKGCSGETFLAAVEHMLDKKPPFCVLENVQNAPWDKMAEYIEGRIKLSSCDEKKAITGAKKDEKLEFVYKDGQIIVDKVPSVFGVRCESAIAGYSEPKDLKAGKVHAIEWPRQKSKSQRCTLDELVKFNHISMANDTLVFDVPIRYHTTKIKVDTKDFGLPQTRNRMYLFVWRAEDGDDLGEYWKCIVEHLKSPVRHSLEAFVLQEDHDIIRVFREALRGPAGRTTKRGRFLESDFWTSTSANLPHNKNCREKLGLDDMARPITDWGAFGKKQIPPHYWLEFLNCCTQRQLDLIDILHASAARDAECHDSSFASFVWNISQNATREKHRTACPGISGCVTPGGDFFLPHFGRVLLGCEKLLLQGIPYFRLALGTETEVQLGDLAGNAMSLTVVGATLLAAICCKQLRSESKQQAKTLQSELQLAKKILTKSTTIREPQLTSGQDNLNDHVNGFEFIQRLASLCDEAIATSVWCTCESSLNTSMTSVFYECSTCRISCCQDCTNSTAGYQMNSHAVCKRIIPREERELGAFDAKLRNILPPTLVFSEDALAELESTGSHSVIMLGKLSFNLHRISRLRRSWHIVYFARESQVGEALAEVSIRVGDISEGEKGALVEFRSFLPAKIPPLKYGPIGPLAVWRCTEKAGANNKQKWMGAREIHSVRSLTMVGETEGKSFRASVGLTKDAEQGVNNGCQKSHNKKSFAEAKRNGEERRWLYAKNWSTWPDVINISDSVAKECPTFVGGTYIRADCRQTVNQDALWIRRDGPPLHLLIKPQVSRTGPDFAIVSRSISATDDSSIVAILPEFWQPEDTLLDKSQVIKHVQFPEWFGLDRMQCLVPSSKIKVSSSASRATTGNLLHISGLSQGDCQMLLLHAKKSDAKQVTLQMATGQKAQQITRAFNSICVSKILRHAAANEIGYDLRPEADWLPISPVDSTVPFGTCSKTFPRPPTERWRFDSVRTEWERIYGEGESKVFYEALEKRPLAFQINLNKQDRTVDVNLRPDVVAHYAAGHLSRGRGLQGNDDIRVSVKLCAAQFQSDPILDAFVVPGCHEELPTDVALRAPYQLYDRQKKVVSKMLAIENRETIFTETEMYNEYMPGSTGWSLTARAQRDARIAGGVIADAIGAGKTVISIGLILKGLNDARTRNKTIRQSSATLVVVPSHLIGQWKSEIEKFTNGLRVMCIYDLDGLQKVKMQELVQSDCVICPVDILESKGYLSHLVKTSGLKFDDSPKMPAYAGQKELTGATGIWIPATSADPYGGANSSHNQKRRNASARYTHVYLSAVHKLREKEFVETKRGVPLEYFEWERIIVDEIHESLCCTKEEVDASNDSRGENEIFKEKNRRAGRELLGIMTRDPAKRPLVARKAIFGLTGTPLLDSSSRVIELASLIGCTYVLGLSSHWRKLERESCRDIFLHYYLEPKQSRLIRQSLYEQCQKYISTACCRNKVGDEMNGIKLKSQIRTIKMTKEEGELYLKSQSGIPPPKKSFAITPEDFDVTAGHDITRFLRQNIDLDSRKQKLVELCREILDKDPTTKIVVFVDGRVGGGVSARKALEAEEGLGCTWLDPEDSTEVRNQKISWYQHGDATDEDKKRPRVLLLHFEHAAGLNLQSECYNLILYCPLYIGNGGANSDPVSDVSTELQATGRVYRPGQQHPVVNVFRIEVRGPDDEECLDGNLIRRNTDEEAVAMAVNSGDS